MKKGRDEFLVARVNSNMPKAILEALNSTAGKNKGDAEEEADAVF
jgi:hypothetical protein